MSKKNKKSTKRHPKLIIRFAKRIIPKYNREETFYLQKVKKNEKSDICNDDVSTTGTTVWNAVNHSTRRFEVRIPEGDRTNRGLPETRSRDRSERIVLFQYQDKSRGVNHH